MSKLPKIARKIRPPNYPDTNALQMHYPNYYQTITQNITKLLKSEFTVEYKYHENPFLNVTKP